MLAGLSVALWEPWRTVPGDVHRFVQFFGVRSEPVAAAVHRMAHDAVPILIGVAVVLAVRTVDVARRVAGGS